MRLSLVWIIFLVLTSFVSAETVENYNIEFNIAYGKVVAEHKIEFSDSVSDKLEFSIAEDAEKISVYANGDFSKYVANGDKLILNLKTTNNVSYNYITKAFVDKENFLLDFKSLHDIGNFSIKVVLPSGASLRKPIKKGDLSSGSIYPAPSSISTDGQSIILEWHRESLKKGDALSIFVMYDEDRGLLPLIVILILVVIIIFVFFIKRRERVVEKVVEDGPISFHLKEDEEQIVNILKKREGRKCEQGTLRVITGFSKATLSRLLKELEDRKVVFKEKRGKKNVVFLRK